MLHGVQITGGTWANNGTLTIADASGSVAMFLPPAGPMWQAIRSQAES